MMNDGKKMMNDGKKMMKVFNYFAVFVCMMTAFGAANVSAQRTPPIKLKKAVDISVRPALYFGPGVMNPQPISKDSRYVTAGNKIVLTPADAVSSGNGVYNFNMMYIVYGSPMKDAVALGEFTDRLRIGNNLLNQHTVKFSDADSGNNDTKIQYVRTTVQLPIGTHVITLSLDDDKKIAESDEGNNTHTFTVEVVAKP